MSIKTEMIIVGHIGHGTCIGTAALERISEHFGDVLTVGEPEPMKLTERLYVHIPEPTYRVKEHVHKYRKKLHK